MFEPSQEPSIPDNPSNRSSTRRIAIIVSVLFHIALLIALLCWYLPEHSQPIAQAENQAAASNKIQRAKDDSNSSIPANPGENVPATEVLASLENAVSQAQRLSDERQLSELEKQLKRLNSISSEESVQETTNKIANTLGLTPGPIPTENSVPGGFDHKTAQIHNVNRIRDEHGNWQYRSILVDAAGRTEEVALPANEGEVTYKTFQQLKQFPVADGIYRQVVMPMLQNMLNAMDAAETQAREIRRTQLEQESPLQDAGSIQQTIPDKNTPPHSKP